METSPLFLKQINGQFHQPRVVDDGECGAVGEMLGRGDRSTRTDSARVALFTTNPI
jgi:hypothetical protein